MSRQLREEIGRLPADAWRLRFAAFTIMGKLVSHAGSSLLRIATEMMVSLLAPGSRSRAVLSPG